MPYVLIDLLLPGVDTAFNNCGVLFNKLYSLCSYYIVWFVRLSIWLMSVISLMSIFLFILFWILYIVTVAVYIAWNKRDDNVVDDDDDDDGEC